MQESVSHFSLYRNNICNLLIILACEYFSLLFDA